MANRLTRIFWNPPEAALLAGLPRGPSRYNPFRNPERAKVRRDWVLSQMLKSELISEREYAVTVRGTFAERAVAGL